MLPKSQIIFSNAHYTATELSRGLGLVVQSRRTGKGTHLTNPAAEEWIDAIKGAIDPHEAHALCRAVKGA